MAEDPKGYDRVLIEEAKRLAPECIHGLANADHIWYSMARHGARKNDAAMLAKAQAYETAIRRFVTQRRLGNPAPFVTP